MLAEFTVRKNFGKRMDPKPLVWNSWWYNIHSKAGFVAFHKKAGTPSDWGLSTGFGREIIKFWHKSGTS